MNEFFVGNYRVDMGRCQIIDKDAIVSMEPKVLQVLLILAENQGQVVSHETLLNKVWPNVQVAPNALQRCIAQLRKAFNDDAKTQQVITTHPKIGYSLVANVNWLQQSPLAKTIPVNQSKRKPLWILGLAAISLSFVLLLAYQINSSNNQLPIQHLTALTSTDNKEFSPTFSPDGRYIAFQRYVATCQNQLWALDIQTKREYLLTKEVGKYGTPSWSPDSQQLAFSNVTSCGQEPILRGCVDIRALSFTLAKTAPQKTRQLLACDKQDYYAVVWLANNKIAFLATEANQSKLMSLTLENSDKLNTSEALAKLHTYETPLLLDPYSLAYSENLNQLAVMQHDLSRNSSLLLVDPDNGKSKMVELAIPDEYKDYLYWNTNWHPQRNNLITSTGASLFEIELNGDMTEHPITTYQGIYDPYFHPDGSKIVAAMGDYDSDIGELKWGSDPTNQQNLIGSSQILSRSTQMEREAQYQPNGEQVAFISNRNGSNQIWLTPKTSSHFQAQQTQPIQLSQLQSDKLEIDTFIWSTDGQLIIYLAGKQLHLLNMDGQSQPLITPFSVLDIYQSLEANKLLLKIIDDQQVKIISFDINSQGSKVLYLGANNWALQTPDESLYFSDENKQIFQIVDEAKQRLDGLVGKIFHGKFFYQQGFLYAFDDDKNFWQVDLATGQKTLFLEKLDHIKAIDDLDINRRNILFSQSISAKKEIVLFH